MARLFAILALLLIGILIGASFSPLSAAISSFLSPAELPHAPSPLSTPLVLPRPLPAVTAVPPTLVAQPTPSPTLTRQTTRSFVIRLRDGGEMTVQANSLDAAINNVKSQGGDPAPNQEP